MLRELFKRYREYPALLEERNGLVVDKEALISQLADVKANCKEKPLLEKLDNLSKEYDKLKSQIVPDPNEEYWNNKKPQANILYAGRILPTTKTQIEIDVRLFITPQDFEITNWVKTNNLSVKNPKQCNSDILKIYKEHQKKWFKYEFDDKNFGIAELWLFPHEYRAWLELEDTGLDCDDHACSLASTMIAAGVPNWRVRVVAGKTRGGIGHLTLYVLDDDMKTWRHLNSTDAVASIPNEFSYLPTSKSPGDKIGIDPNSIWFSFNNSMSWHEFETGSARKSFDKHKQKFRIVT